MPAIHVLLFCRENILIHNKIAAINIQDECLNISWNIKIVPFRFIFCLIRKVNKCPELFRYIYMGFFLCHPFTSCTVYSLFIESFVNVWCGAHTQCSVYKRFQKFNIICGEDIDLSSIYWTFSFRRKTEADAFRIIFLKNEFRIDG